MRACAIVVLMAAGPLGCGPGKPAKGTAGGATGAGTSTGGVASTGTGTAGTMMTTTVPTSSGTGTTGGSSEGVWRGKLEVGFYGLVLVDCASGQSLALLTDFGCDGLGGQELFVEVAGVLHPDGPDFDDLDEIEVTQFLAGPCREADCSTDEWADCVQFVDVCSPYRECDPWVQDCPANEKCMPYSGDGDNAWESLKCTPVMPGAGGEGDPCTVVDSEVSGIDSCAKGHLCWDVDPVTKMGTCVAQCTGTPDKPQCPNPCTSCLLADDGVLTICLGECDPLAQDCGAAEECIPYPLDLNSFICVIDDSGTEGQLFDACDIGNACDPGLWCAPPAMAVECDQAVKGCCLPFCDLSAPTCPGAGQECAPWFGDQPAPPCQENIGVCKVP